MKLVAFASVLACAILAVASTWWEKAWGTYLMSEMSPDGCLRIDSFEPFWVLPSSFHRSAHPDATTHLSIGNAWEAAVFRRLYEHSTGVLLGETPIYDPVQVLNGIHWGESARIGRRQISVNGFELASTDRCSDAVTLGRLEQYYAAKRKSLEAQQELWVRASEGAGNVSSQ